MHPGPSRETRTVGCKVSASNMKCALTAPECARHLRDDEVSFPNCDSASLLRLDQIQKSLRVFGCASVRIKCRAVTFRRVAQRDTQPMVKPCASPSPKTLARRLGPC